MNTQQLLEWFDSQKQQSDIITLTTEVLQSLDKDNIQTIISQFHAHTFIKLPESEIAFFQWLYTVDQDVWNDLWKSEDNEEPYIVGLSLLGDLVAANRGFPICDLMTTDNFYFSSEHFIKGESDDFIEAIHNKVLSDSPLTMSQLLAWEIYTAPIDIWRFCYIHKVSIHEAKKAVHELVEDRILIHLKSAAELTAYMEL